MRMMMHWNEPLVNFLTRVQNSNSTTLRMMWEVQAQPANNRNSLWRMGQSGLLLFQGKAYVPNDPALRDAII